MSNIDDRSSPRRSIHRSSGGGDHQPTNKSRSPFRRSRGLLTVLRQKFATKSARSNDAADDSDSVCRHSGYSVEMTATLCSSWRSRPRHVDKPIRPAYSDECLSCCASSRCIRNRLQRSQAAAAGREDLVKADRPLPGGNKRCGGGGGGGGSICKHCHKKSDQSSPSDFDSSDRELSQSEEEKVRDILPVDAEYGHASAPNVSQVIVVVSDVHHTTHSSVSDSASDVVAGPSGADDVPTCGEAAHDVTFETQAVQPTQPFYDQVKEPVKGWSLSQELFRLSRYGWYWGPITRVEAEEKLAGQADGAFLVRDSSDERYLLSLSFRSYGRTLHTRIEHCNGVFSFYAQHESEGYSSIVDLIEHSMTDSQSGVFCYSRARLPGSPSFPVRLAKPVSRFAQVRSLQYLCRFIIRQYTRVDHIQQLPLPTSIKGWLEENQY